MDNENIELFKEVKKTLEGITVPRNTELALLKIKETLEIDNSDINMDDDSLQTQYSIRYENLLIQVTVDYYNQKFIVSKHFDVVDEFDNIVECY